MGCSSSKPKASEPQAAATPATATGQAEQDEAPVLLHGQPADGIPEVKGGTTLAGVVQRLELRGSCGEEFTYVSHRDLEPERRARLAACFPQCTGEHQVLAVVAKDAAGALKEFVVSAKDGASAELVPGTCQITFEDMTPSECIEYAFSEAPDHWTVAQISRGAMESYRSMKFDAWKQMLTHGTCEAQLRRMLQIGVVTRLYDDHVFPTTESQRAHYEVIDEKNGKVIKLPHPVAALRIWDPAQLQYESIDPQLVGAPREEEKEAWWEGMIRTLQAQMGADYIDSFLKRPMNSLSL
mmetsp:Transcript_34075/g.98044  ORF Transcript_34075/g.98044 Transcript_34075/m.98044 type:complete len:296 (+) Transcript_34075:57-944(+)